LKERKRGAQPKGLTITFQFTEGNVMVKRGIIRFMCFLIKFDLEAKSLLTKALNKKDYDDVLELAFEKKAIY
jgi:hypothetical protein